MPDKIEWTPIKSVDSSDRAIEVAKVEAQREIAEELHRLNDSIDQLILTVPPDDEDRN